ncbi:ribulose-1,5 bisphosphate carboxylase/oxygenase large subunit N-methyltransferase, chloroplastic [Selaginella moellendorffii]|nr:ribulose-1,5 bisphosphate carboxylase/oxygenase large subunit N-methyltransferase, chloroplastic [Selaginella moellendorffii]|eukprot:XP_002986460.2 ribulose-1,5 bisphosphate carboxylase/oxygenase large subunit N-methyltransferase, chloroplastic [Selaginella moellendorffii]
MEGIGRQRATARSISSMGAHSRATRPGIVDKIIDFDLTCLADVKNERHGLPPLRLAHWCHSHTSLGFYDSKAMAEMPLESCGCGGLVVSSRWNPGFFASAVPLKVSLLSRLKQQSSQRWPRIRCVSSRVTEHSLRHQPGIHIDGGDGARAHPRLMDWMLEQGLPPCKVSLKERDLNGKTIRYVVASEDLKPGDLALSVPMSLVVTLERVLGNETIAELLTTNKLSELACLALYLMYEKKRGKESFWYPFIRELDRQRGRGQVAVESPLLWTSEELDEYFTGSRMKEVVLERLEGIKREYQELDTVWFMAGSLFKEYPFDIPTEAFSFEIFKQAFVAVQSCVVHLQGVSLPRRFALVPLGPPLLAYKSNCKAMLKAAGDLVRLEVDRAYKKGEQILVWCGPQPNTRLLLNYGFVDPDNPHDRLSVEASLNTRDPFYQNKRIIVQKNNRLTIQNFQIFKGREKEAVLEMLPYLRLGHVSDPYHMESVFSAEGPTCPVSACNERAVLDQLAQYFQERIAKYKTTIDEDRALLEDCSSDINPKQRVATQLLLIEKEILHNTLDVVNGFRNQLPDGSVAPPCCGDFVPKLK